MARVFSEKAWHSSKVSNINPREWRPEYAWLVAIAYVDGTFEADPQDIWARAYAYARPDWSAEKVALLLDEFERVGLLQRTKDEDGRVWGYWTGAAKFTPPPSKWKHYRSGKLDLFTAGVHKVHPDAAQGLQQVHTEGELCAGSIGVGVGSSSRTCLCIGTCVCKAPKTSENNQPQERVSDSCLEATPTTAEATATPTPKKDRKRPVLDAFEYDRLKVAKTAAEMKAEYDALPLCSVCSRRHSPDWLCKPSAEVKQ